MNKPQSGALFNDCAHLLTIYPRGVHFVLKQVSIFKTKDHLRVVFCFGGLERAINDCPYYHNETTRRFSSILGASGNSANRP